VDKQRMGFKHEPSFHLLSAGASESMGPAGMVSSLKYEFEFMFFELLASCCGALSVIVIRFLTTSMSMSHVPFMLDDTSSIFFRSN
jgi:hypothetical protein